MTMFLTVTEQFFIVLCLCLFLKTEGENTSASSIMNISAISTKANNIIQKIPVGRTQIKKNLLDMPTQETPNLTTEIHPTEISTVNVISTTELHNLSSSQYSEQEKDAMSSQTSCDTVTDAVTNLAVPTSSQSPLEVTEKCPELNTIPNIDSLTQDEFLKKLTESCRYDRLVRPPTADALPLYFQIDLMHVESNDYLQLKAHILVQLLYSDYRLDYRNISPSRGYILGEEPLRNKIWVPHIIVLNERESSLMGLDGKDVFVQVSPDGQVIYSYRMTTMFYCWMNLQKFPFDHQICEIKWVSWAYNASNLRMIWDESRPFHVASNLHLTEFVVENTWCSDLLIPPSFDRGGLAGNYSGVVFKMKLRREVGYYMMDYFLPSILLVCMSWVTFWLQADAAPPRVTLGTSTMLTFITLNGGLSKSLPKVSYIKASEIWFLGCASFIFFSLAEFAFVNVIWRRRKKVELKKQNSKHILKGALTPSLARKQLRKAESINNLYKTRSCSSLSDSADIKSNMQVNYLTIHSFPSHLSVPKITTQSEDDMSPNDDSITTIPIPESAKVQQPQPTWTTMTPQEVAIWIDNKSRIVFPVSFLIFNLFYWTFVYAL